MKLLILKKGIVLFIKEKINKKILTILNTNDTDEDNSPVKIEVSRRRHQNLIKIGEKPESPKKKKVTFGNEEFKAAIGNEKVSFTSLMNNNKPSFTSMAKNANKKSRCKSSNRIGEIYSFYRFSIRFNNRFCSKYIFNKKFCR